MVAAASGVGFGLFQTLNIRAVRGMDPFASTFVQIAVAATALLAASVASGGLGALAGAPARRSCPSRARASCTSSRAGRC